MNREQLIDHINHRREIEFRFHGKMYSVTYGVLDRKHVISFCEFNKETTEFETAEKVVEIVREGVSVIDMLESLSDEDIWIY